MKYLIGIIGGILAVTTSAFAVDGQLSSQYTHYLAGYQTFDTQLNVGQQFHRNIIRPYVQIQWVNASQQGVINDSQISYAGGAEVRVIPDKLKVEGGGGYYQPLNNSKTQHNEFYYIKATYAFDTDAK